MTSRSTALGTWKLATDFVSAGHLAAAEPSPLTIPAYYLYGHALELVLKAFLKAKGCDDTQLRGIGHDLARAVEECQRQGFTGCVDMAEEQRTAIADFSAYYEGKEFEYLYPGYKRLPSLDLLRQIAESLLSGARSVCAAAYEDGR